MMGQEPTGDRLARLLEVDTSEDPAPPAPNWEHEVGSVLEGTFLRWVTKSARFEKPEQAALIEDASGTRYLVWCRLTMLKSEMRRTVPRPGDSITIKRGADKDTGKPHPLQTFRITVVRKNRPPARADWNLEGGTR